MYLDDIIAIHSRLSNVPKELRATAHSYGPPVVMVTCKTAREAELVASSTAGAKAPQLAPNSTAGDTRHRDT